MSSKLKVKISKKISKMYLSLDNCIHNYVFRLTWFDYSSIWDALLCGLLKKRTTQQGVMLGVVERARSHESRLGLVPVRKSWNSAELWASNRPARSFPIPGRWENNHICYFVWPYAVLSFLSILKKCTLNELEFCQKHARGSLFWISSASSETLAWTNA